MNVAVLGLWHLGSVTAACLAARRARRRRAGIRIRGRRAICAEGAAPISEPGLDELARGRDSPAGRLTLHDRRGGRRPRRRRGLGHLRHAGGRRRSRRRRGRDRARAARRCRIVRDGALVIVSSQLPVGSVARLERDVGDVVARAGRPGFACSPENLRLGKAIEVFTKPDRIVVGVRDRRRDRARSRRRCSRRSRTGIDWMSVESAEMTKHAINAFLATSVTFINELATLCERGRRRRHGGRDAGSRPISGSGRGAYLVARRRIRRRHAGARSRAARGPRHRHRPRHAARLAACRAEQPRAPGMGAPRRWPQAARRARRPSRGGLGLTYKPGTDTLRRSPGVELCPALAREGATVTRLRSGCRASLPDELDRRAHARRGPARRGGRRRRRRRRDRVADVPRDLGGRAVWQPPRSRSSSTPTRFLTAHARRATRASATSQSGTPRP